MSAIATTVQREQNLDLLFAIRLELAGSEENDPGRPLRANSQDCQITRTSCCVDIMDSLRFRALVGDELCILVVQ